jgi:hypothetical protein
MVFFWRIGELIIAANECSCNLVSFGQWGVIVCTNLTFENKDFEGSPARISL